MSASVIEDLRREIAGQADVRRVLKLVPLAGGRFAYLIETPFETFPKFVVGTTASTNEDVRIGLRCGAEWSACDYFDATYGTEAAR